ncbi:MAG: hypothetical protein ABL949_17275 [Fimbriimonadaceae bacterium]
MRTGAEGSKSAPISFRLDDAAMNKLRKEAARNGLSPGDLVRLIVVNHLEDANRKLVLDELLALHRAIKVLNNNLATATSGVLVACGSQSEVAAEWVKTRLEP